MSHGSWGLNQVLRNLALLAAKAALTASASASASGVSPAFLRDGLLDVAREEILAGQEAAQVVLLRRNHQVAQSERAEEPVGPVHRRVRADEVGSRVHVWSQIQRAVELLCGEAELVDVRVPRIPPRQIVVRDLGQPGSERTCKLAPPQTQAPSRGRETYQSDRLLRRRDVVAIAARRRAVRAPIQERGEDAAGDGSEDEQAGFVLSADDREAVVLRRREEAHHASYGDHLVQVLDGHCHDLRVRQKGKRR
eukprot:scaffold1311_cov256-Pinguiococcus_pyrenoidosus.AAC.66